MHPFTAFRQSPWAFPSALPSRIDPSLVIEENSPYYKSAYCLSGGDRFRPSLATEADRVCGLQGTFTSSRRWSNERYVALELTPIIPTHDKLLLVALSWRCCSI
ncbi:uncharacterized protein N7515_004178 [Penicillium bovifimosum]|uniref:Uncharacterized protein n=1 Tax=Penicillium bovifimosum TaxID=126998 RepID=A0A9W9H622_9EURO|nr:uncharacterized protein N7515_004178 [Penicillium bovifimosum]KAJ5139330.1 hypothetical protein N7515_004178 [Penicillium bovifimosum]